MADDNGHIAQTLEDIKTQIATKVAEAARLLPTANHLAEMIGVPPVALSDFIDDADGHASDTAPAVASGRPSGGVPATPRGSARHIKPDTFLGQPPLDAAKKYMAMVGHATHIDEIASAVERGGAAVRGADWREKLEMGLLRSTADIVKVQDKTYGLVTFYTPAQIEGLRGTRRREKPKAKAKRSAKTRDKGPVKKSGSSPAKATAEGTTTKDAPKGSAASTSPPDSAVH